MIAAISLLIARVASFSGWFVKLALAAFTALWLLSTDLGCWVVDQVLGFAVESVGGINTAPLLQYTSAWGSLPAEIINILGLLRVGEAAAIIVTAIGIRLALQIIPATRLGS